MKDNYYKACKELDECLKLDQYWHSKEYEKWFNGYLKIATAAHYPLAECQVGFSYLMGIGTEKNYEKGLYWTHLSAHHGDRDGQYNLAWIYEEGLGVEIDLEKARYWVQQAALQNHDLAIEKCKEWEIS